MKSNSEQEVVSVDSSLRLILMEKRVKKWADITGGFALLTLALFGPVIFWDGTSVWKTVLSIAGTISVFLLFLSFVVFQVFNAIRHMR